MPVLDWIGKKQVINHDKEVPFRLLKRVESLSVGESENLIIKGDNLEALKALLPYYYNKVKCIYIDLPYNTGNENWIYNDIENHLNAYAKAQFDKLLADNRFVIDLRQAYTIADTLEIYNPHQEVFQKSVFEKAGKLNDEEYRLAKEIDDLSNVKWWFRNLDRDGFYIQGYLLHAFNPDFIVETKSGMVIALEYKGKHLADREYKEEVGNIWGSLNDKYKFIMATKSDIEAKINGIKNL